MKNKWLYLLALLMFALDRASKMLLGGADVTVLGGLLRIARVENTGMAFGWMTGKTALLAVFTVVILAVVLWMIRGYTLRGCALIGAGVMLGGALGNLYDRLFVGHVIDLFDVTFIDFFVFNVADAGITLGAAALGVGILFRPKDFIKT